LVNGVGEATFVQSAGFLRIHGGDNPLDSTSIHPESYTLASDVLKRADVSLAELFVKPQPVQLPVSDEKGSATQDSKSAPAAEASAATPTEEAKPAAPQSPTEAQSPAQTPAVEESKPETLADTAETTAEQPAADSSGAAAADAVPKTDAAQTDAGATPAAESKTTIIRRAGYWSKTS